MHGYLEKIKELPHNVDVVKNWNEVRKVLWEDKQYPPQRIENELQQRIEKIKEKNKH